MEIYPKQLVWVEVEDTCMFCNNRNDSPLISYVCVETKLGYISCIGCEKKLEEAVKKWYEYYDIEYLKNKDIKIMRSSGEIESGWIISTPININSDDIENMKIYCLNENKDLTRWCRIEDILKLNPREYIRNLCVNCGIDMGVDNPRQLCYKTYCPYEEGENINK